MSTQRSHRVEETVLVRAPIDVVRERLLDVVTWPQYHAKAIHAEVERAGDGSELVRHWSVVDGHTVRSWSSRRRLTDDGTRLQFAHEPAGPRFHRSVGGWCLSSADDGATRVTMYHEFELREEVEGQACEFETAFRRGSRAHLDTLREVTENRDELARRTLSFEDPLFVAGSVADAYAYLYEADRWPERIPHVSRLALEQPSPDVQFFDMETSTPDGVRHTTRSVRICLENDKIVYKQTTPPKALAAHTGHWLFTPVPEGFLVSARHTVTIKPDALHLFGDGMTIEDARRYLRRVLSANSMSNLRLAKAYAEERAGVATT